MSTPSLGARPLIRHDMQQSSAETIYLQNSRNEPSSVNETREKLSDEQGTAPIRSNRWLALLECTIHFLPIAVTIGALQLSFRNVYWLDVGAAYVNTYKDVLQIVAKAHEILIILSLSKAALYYLRCGLLSTRGVPLGIVSTAYRVSLGGQPWESGLLSILKENCGKWRCDYRRNYISKMLVLYVFIVAMLTLVTGPASTIMVIPRLEWWTFPGFWTLFNLEHQPDLHPGAHPKATPDFALYIPRKLFPTNLTAATLPGKRRAKDSVDPEGYPYEGFKDIVAHVSESNFTFGTAIARRMVSVLSGNLSVSELGPESHNAFGAVSYTSSLVLSSYLVRALESQGLLNLQTPFTAGIETNRSAPLQAAASVVCIQDIQSRFIRNISDLFMVDNPLGNTPLKHDINPDWNVTMDIRNLWSEALLNQTGDGFIALQWLSHTLTSHLDPIPLAVILHGKTSPAISAITICTRNAEWFPVKQWVFSQDDPTVVTDDPYANLSSKRISLLSSLSNNVTFAIY